MNGDRPGRRGWPESNLSQRATALGSHTIRTSAPPKPRADIPTRDSVEPDPWADTSRKLLLHNNRTCADAICCAADSNQRHLLVDALPFEPSLGPNRAVVRWLIWAVERSAAHEHVLIWARNDAADASDDVSGPQRGCQAGAMPAWTPFQRLGATANSRSCVVSRRATFSPVRI